MSIKKTMQRYLLKITFLLMVLIAGCSGGPEKFKISGIIENGKEKTILLEEMSISGLRGIDSVICSSNGSFSLGGVISTPGFFNIRIKGNQTPLTLAIHPGEEIVIHAMADEFPGSYTVDGSEDSKLIKELNDAREKTSRQITALGKIFHDSLQSRNILTIKASLDSSYIRICEEQVLWSKEFVRQNKNLLAGLMALYQQLPSDNPNLPSYVLAPEEHFELYRIVDSTLNKLYPTSEPVKSLHAQVLMLQEKYNEENRIRKITGIGAIPPDIRLPSPKKDTLSLYAMRGKYVLLVFWASFDQKSRVENKTIHSLYYNYHWKGLDVFQVSLDRSRDAWVNAISSDGLIWPQVSDLKYWNSPLVNIFSIKELPAIYLLDKEGKVIGSQLEGERLSAAVQEVFRKKTGIQKTIAPVMAPVRQDSLIKVPATGSPAGDSI
jgi:peroxiredoxin